MANKFYDETPYNYAGNNSIINIDVDGKFKYPKNKEKQYRDKYKNFTNYLSKGGVNNLLNSQTVLDAYQKWAGFDKNKLENEFKWGGKSPTIVIGDPPNGVNGAKGVYSNNTIYLSEKLVMLFENANENDRQAALIVVLSTLLHELAHKGFIPDGSPEWMYERGEAGDGLASDIFATYIMIDGKKEKSYNLGLHGTAIFDPDFGKKSILGAKDFIENAKDDEDRKKIIPTIDAWLTNAIKVNPNIKVYSN